MKRYDAVVAGYTCVDLIPDFNKDTQVGKISELLIPGKLIEIKGMDIVLGGVVPNTGLAMKKFGKKVYFNGQLGNDAIGIIAEGLLRQNNAFDGMIKTDKASTAFSILLSPIGVDRIFLESPGCNHIFNVEDINFQAVGSARLFHFGYPPLMRQFFIDGGQNMADMFSSVQEMGVITSLDFSLPDSKSESGKVDWPTVMRKTLPFVDIFVPSIEELVRIMKPEQYEAIQSTLHENEDIINAIPLELIAETSKQIIGLGVNVIMIKAGAKGVYMFTGEGTSVNTKLGHVPDERWNDRKIFCNAFYAEPDKIINASGAGDTAIAAFLSAVLNGESPELALKYAAMAGRNNLYCKNIYSDLKDWGEMSKEISLESNKIIELSDVIDF